MSSDIAPISQPNVRAVSDSPGAASRQSEPDATARPDDKVELSVKARLLSKLAEMPDVREDKVNRVRAEIEAGTYDTEDEQKIDELLDELIQDL